ncbi:hypothetical protein GW17_00032292 [Ensete ventricosum]|nr:hypothetical protein GW17_00032292 [Ensete ventricosum]
MCIISPSTIGKMWELRRGRWARPKVQLESVTSTRGFVVGLTEDSCTKVISGWGPDAAPPMLKSIPRPRSSVNIVCMV